MSYFLFQLSDIYNLLRAANLSLESNPMGQPVLLEKYHNGGTVTLVPMPHATLAFDTELNTPLWVSQTLGSVTNVSRFILGLFLPLKRKPVQHHMHVDNAFSYSECSFCHYCKNKKNRRCHFTLV